MRLKEIYNLADGIAPFALSDEYCGKVAFRDNSGIQLDCGGEIGKILFSLDLSAAAVEKAVKIGADCVFTHHPAIFLPLYSLTEEGAGKQILACAKAGISVISAHINLDCAKDGIDESLMKGLGGKSPDAVQVELSGGAYGRVFGVPEQTFAEFAEHVRKEFWARRVVLYGDRPVRKAACFCGAGMDEESVSFALANGADTFVSSDGKHHLVTAAVEGGMNVLLLTHYASENYGFYRFYQKFKEKSGVLCEYFADERFL